MTYTDMDTYLWEVQSLLTVSKPHRVRILEELRSHIEDGVIEYTSAGVPEAEATALVIGELGSAESVAASFDAAHDQGRANSSWTRSLPLVVAVGSCVIALALLAWSLTWANSGWTVGEQIAQRQLLWATLTSAAATVLAYACIRRAAVSRTWLVPAWACSLAPLLVPLFI